MPGERPAAAVRWRRSRRGRGLSRDRHRCPLADASQPAPMRRSTCHATRLHVVGVGGPGMSAIALALAEMGHDVSGSRPARAAGARSAARRRRHGARRSRPVARRRLRRGHGVDCDPGRPQRARRGAQAGHPDAAAGRHAGLDLRPGPIARRRRHARQDDDDVDADADPRRGRSAPELRDRRRRHRHGHRRALDRRRVVRRRGRRERRHPPRAAAARHDPHQRRGRPPRPLRLVRRHRRRRSTATSRRSPGPKVVCADDPGRGAARRPARQPSRTASAEGVDVRAVDVHASRGSFPFDVERDGQRLGDVSLPLRGVHNVRQRHRRAGDGDRARRRVRRSRRRRSPSSAASPAASTSAASTAGRRSSTTTPTCRRRSTPCSTPHARSGDGWQRVVAVFQPNRYNRMAEMWRDYADAFVDADVVVLTDIYPSGTQPIPGVTGKLVVNAVLDAHPTRACRVAARARRPGRRSSPARCAPATCASRWAAATSPRCPTRCCAAPTRRRRRSAT